MLNDTASVGSASFSMGRERSAGSPLTYVPPLELTIVRKTRPGFDGDEVARIRQAIADVAQGRHGPSKFLVFDLATASGSVTDEIGFDHALREAADLILEAPVVSIAWCRGRVEGGDLELALACSMIVAEPEATFSFDFGLIDCLRSYARLAHRLGFVHAERLIEGGAVLGAEAMRDAHLVKAVVPAAADDEGIGEFVRSRMRRHNSAYGIYRAQRLAMPTLR